MPKVYIASHSKDLAIEARDVLVSKGCEVISTWLDGEFKRTAEYTEAERRDIAARDAAEVYRADMLVLIAGDQYFAGGKFVEAGIALGLGRRVVVVGRRENMLLWHPVVEQVDRVDDIDPEAP